jgi:hypothetical protein
MVILRAFLALAEGLATIALLSLLVNALLRRFTPDWAAREGKPGASTEVQSPRRLSAGAFFVQAGSALLTGAAGGYVTALAARGNPLVHVLALGMVVLALTALSALQAKGEQPVSLQLTLVAISPLGVLAGGLLRLRVLGIL